MTYGSLEELFSAKVASLGRLQYATRTLTVSQTSIRPPDGGWSIQEILEHLSLVESQLLHLVTTLLERAEKISGTDSPVRSYEVSLEQVIQRSSREKFSTRDKYQPTGRAEALASIAILQQVQEDLRGLIPRLQSVDPTVARFPHWIFGSLDLGEWLAFIVVHEERHLMQIEAIMAAREFSELDR